MGESCTAEGVVRRGLRYGVEGGRGEFVVWRRGAGGGREYGGTTQKRNQAGLDREIFETTVG